MTRDMAGLRETLRRAGALKDTLRSGFTQEGRREDAAAHSWRLSLLALLLADDRPDLDAARVLALAIVHDLPEAEVGDTPAIAPSEPGVKSAAERAGLARLLCRAPAASRARLGALWEEYESGATPEARWVKALDKIETLATHAEGTNPPNFDYAFNLDYGRAATDREPRAATLRALIDIETTARAAKAPGVDIADIRGAEAAALARTTLASLPEWFGRPEAAAAYVAAAEIGPTLAALVDREAAGFATLAAPNPACREIRVMAVRRDRRRRGLGRALAEAAARRALAEGAQLLSVRTVAEAAGDPHYAETRAFYGAAGFLPVAEERGLWGSEAPSLLMVRSL